MPRSVPNGSNTTEDGRGARRLPRLIPAAICPVISSFLWLSVIGLLAACEPQPADLGSSPPPQADAGAAEPTDSASPEEADPPAAPAPIDTEPAAPACGRNPAEIMVAFGKHSKAINACVVAAQRRKTIDKRVRTVNLDLVVLPSGVVQDVAVHTLAGQESPMQLCIRKVLNKIKFRPASGGDCPVTLPLNIAPRHRGRSR